MCFIEFGWSSRSTADIVLLRKRGCPLLSRPMDAVKNPSCTAARITLYSCSAFTPVWEYTNAARGP